MEDRETARMRKYGESETTRIMMVTVPHVTSGLGLRKFEADGFLLTRLYNSVNIQTGYRNNFVIYTCTHCIYCLWNKSVKKKRPDHV